MGLAINDGKRTEREVRNCPLKRGRSTDSSRAVPVLTFQPDRFKPVFGPECNACCGEEWIVTAPKQVSLKKCYSIGHD